MAIIRIPWIRKFETQYHEVTVPDDDPNENVGGVPASVTDAAEAYIDTAPETDTDSASSVRKDDAASEETSGETHESQASSGVSSRGRVLSRMINYISNESMMGKSLKTGELRKKMSEPAWTVPAPFNMTHFDMGDFTMKLLSSKENPDTDHVILQLHGGGYMGAIRNAYYVFAGLYNEISHGMSVLSPDYRVAPENPYPADIDDCFAALKWLADKEANGLPVDTDRIAVAGASSGGGLAIAAALKARDEGGPKICFMLPVYPMLDYRNSSISARQITDTRVWCHSSNGIAWKMYLGDMQNVPAYASPAMADDVAGLPPANIVVGSLDPFRDEDIGFAQRMLDAGVPVELRVIPGAFHIFDRLGTPLSEQAVNGHIAALKNALKK